MKNNDKVGGVRAKTVFGYTLAGFAVLLVFAFIGGQIALSLFLQRDVPGDQLRYPITWGRANEPGASHSSFIELAEDGSAKLVDVVIGEIQVDVDDVEPPCVITGGGSFTGTATWELDDDGALRIHSKDGSALLSPDSARFTGDADWTSIREQFCDASYADYAARSARR
ncbi:hypothetical protein ACNPNP_03120 [Microbacterium sp. AGC85]